MKNNILGNAPLRCFILNNGRARSISILGTKSFEGNFLHEATKEIGRCI